MPTTSIVAMSVSVGGLFLLLLATILMITCMHRKNSRTITRGRRRLEQLMHPGDDLPPGPIACPTISGQIIMREPPPR